MTHRVFANRFLPLPIQACVHSIKAGLDARRDDEPVGIGWGELDPRAKNEDQNGLASVCAKKIETQPRGQVPDVIIGVRGFEPPTSCSQSRRAARLRHTPNFYCVSLSIIVTRSWPRGKGHVGSDRPPAQQFALDGDPPSDPPSARESMASRPARQNGRPPALPSTSGPWIRSSPRSGPRRVSSLRK